MGEVAMWTGLVTGSMMLVSPFIFKRLGWRGIAKATPNFLSWTGLPFFGGCIALAFLRPTTTAPLTVLVTVGAVLQVHSLGLLPLANRIAHCANLHSLVGLHLPCCALWYENWGQVFPKRVSLGICYLQSYHTSLQSF